MTDPKPVERIATCEMCEMCERAQAKQTMQAQTIPGSLDTKFVDMRVCNDCASDYQALLAGIWNKKDIS